MLPQFTKEEEKRAEEEIYRHIIKDYNARGDLGSANGMKMPSDFRNTILYESVFNECVWVKSDWSDLSGNGCQFSVCDICTSKIYNAALQHSLFDSTVFYKCSMRSSNFAYSLISWTALSNCTIEGSAFTGTDFNHAIIRDCKIAHSNFELCKFQDCYFYDMDFKDLALKYTFFRNVHMENVALPFLQMPYTFGGMKYIFTTSDQIKIVSMDHSKPYLSVAEYREYLSMLITFFTGHRDYFPLANCYLASGQIALAEQANEMGIMESASLHDFRKLYFYSIQAAQELNVSREKRYQLYDKMRTMITADRLSRAERHEFRHFFPLIKKLMFDNPNNRPTMAVTLHTNIGADDFHNLGLLMRALDEVVEQSEVALDSKHIEIRHNSPNVLSWFPTGEIDQLTQLIQNTWKAIGPILPDVLQNAANAATLFSSAASLHHLFARGNHQRHPNTKRRSKHLHRAQTKLTDEQVEALHLRAELEKQEKTWRENAENLICPLNQNPTISDSKIQGRARDLISAGIRVNSIEIQVLGDDTDILDTLYNYSEEYMD